MKDERSATVVDGRLGSRLRVRRLEIGMSQEKLAEELGITFQQIQKYEKGVNRIAASRLWDISQALDMPVARFFEGMGTGGFKEAKPDRVSEIMATAEGAQLVRLFVSIESKTLRRKVVDLVRTLTEGA